MKNKVIFGTPAEPLQGLGRSPPPQPHPHSDADLANLASLRSRGPPRSRGTGSLPDYPVASRTGTGTAPDWTERTLL